MSIMDFFESQGTAVPSTGSSGGDWKDWFLDMEGRNPFGRTASPSPDSGRGDWIDWYLNREGFAGRFEGSRRPRHGRDYLFNGGGSVRSRTNRPNMRDVAGPTQIERILQDNTSRPSTGGMDLDMLRNLQQAPGVIDRIIREETPPGGGVIKPENPRLPPWQRYNDIGEGSFWNVRAPQQTEDNLGIMTALAKAKANNQQGNSKKWLEEDNNLSFDISLDPRPNGPEYNSGISGLSPELYSDYSPSSSVVDYSPDGGGRWLTGSPWGQKLLSYAANEWATPGSVEYLQDAIEGGGIPVWGGYAKPIIDWEDDNYGFMWEKGG